MTPRLAIVLTAVLMAVAGAWTRTGAHVEAQDKSKGPEFEARLSGGEEVPPVDTATRGKARISFNRDETKAEYELTVRKGVRVTQSHIHCAPRGVNGPIIVFLAGFHANGWDVDGSWVENATITDANVLPAGTTCPHPVTNLRDLIEAMRAGDTYVNVHTVAHGGGEVRGQIREEGDDD